MEEKDTLTDKFHKNKLSPKILSDSIKIAVFEYENLFKEKTYTNEQIQKKKIFNHFSAIQNVIQDLEKTIIFLKLDYQKILEVYPEISEKKNYYIYHFENYFIRVNTITDLAGKLGNLICNTAIDEEKCNGYNFKEAIKTRNIDIANSLEKVLLYTKDLKIVRHKKIHTGKAEIKNLEDIVLWGDLAKYTKDEFDNILDDLTTIKLDKEIKRLENEINELIKLLNDYFNFLETEYTKI